MAIVAAARRAAWASISSPIASALTSGTSPLRTTHRRIRLEVRLRAPRARRDRRPAGAVGALLDGELDALGQHRRERARRRVDDHHRCPPGGLGGAHGPQHHRQAADLVQHLRELRAHARALARREDQDDGRAHPGDAIRSRGGSRRELGGRDSNPDSQDQNLMSCHWTTPQGWAGRIDPRRPPRAPNARRCAH